MTRFSGNACHIVPWSVSHHDNISNGLALYPNLHRAFERHLLQIAPDHRVRITEGFGELDGHTYGVQQFNGRQLQLPKERKWWPKPENLAAQREAGPW